MLDKKLSTCNARLQFSTRKRTPNIKTILFHNVNCVFQIFEILIRKFERLKSEIYLYMVYIYTIYSSKSLDVVLSLYFGSISEAAFVRNVQIKRNKFVSLYLFIYLLTSVDVVPTMKTAGVVENSGHCIYSIGLKCF